MTRRAGFLAGVIALLGLLAVLAGGAGSATARSTTDVQAVAANLAAAPVYNDPSAERAMTAAETNALIGDCRETGLPYFIAVLPRSALTPQFPTASDYLAGLNRAVGKPGIYAVVIGKDFQAGATRNTVADIATTALQEYRSAGTYAVLQAFVAASAERFGGTVPTSYSEANPEGFPWVSRCCWARVWPVAGI